MKKSAKHIDTIHVRSRRNFRWGAVWCLVVMGLLLHTSQTTDNLLPIHFGELQPEASIAQTLPAPQVLSEKQMPMPLLKVAEPQAPDDLAARPVLVDIEEEPNLMLATISDGFSRLRDMTFFLPAPIEDAAELAELPEYAEIPEISDLNAKPDALSLMASLGTADSTLTDQMRSYLASTLSGASAAGALKSLLSEEAGPVVYPENERYTVERNPENELVFRSAIVQGDTAGVILNHWLSANDVQSVIDCAKPVYSLTSIHSGQPFSVVREASTGNFLRFEYEIDKDKRIVISRAVPPTAANSEARLEPSVQSTPVSNFTAQVEAIEYDTQLVMVNGTIVSSLFETVASQGEGPMLAINMSDIFSCEINFINEIREGDSFSVLVEKRYRNDEFKGYGKMLAATFVNQGQDHQAFLFTNNKGKPTYFNAKGEALQTALLKAPLAFTRVSSGYSMNRKHPVFKDVRAHQGVDYAAPTGTPVKAVGDGVLTRVGWGGGYGNMIVIKHDNGLESQYAHLSGFAKGLKKGAAVRQGQTIGFVGATGTATGPHLDFRLKQNNKFINPTKLIVPRDPGVDAKRLAQFKQVVTFADSYFTEEKPLLAYKPSEWPVQF